MNLSLMNLSLMNLSLGLALWGHPVKAGGKKFSRSCQSALFDKAAEDTPLNLTIEGGETEWRSIL